MRSLDACKFEKYIDVESLYPNSRKAHMFAHISNAIFYFVAVISFRNNQGAERYDEPSGTFRKN